MKKIKILFLLLLAGGGLSHASVQKTLFSADVVASACHVVVDADGTGSSRLTFGTYRKSSAAPVPPRDFTVRLYETGATVQGCSAFLAGQIATLNFGNLPRLLTVERHLDSIRPMSRRWILAMTYPSRRSGTVCQDMHCMPCPEDCR